MSTQNAWGLTSPLRGNSRRRQDCNSWHGPEPVLLIWLNIRLPLISFPWLWKFSCLVLFQYMDLSVTSTSGFLLGTILHPEGHLVFSEPFSMIIVLLSSTQKSPRIFLIVLTFPGWPSASFQKTRKSTMPAVLGLRIVLPQSIPCSFKLFWIPVPSLRPNSPGCHGVHVKSGSHFVTVQVSTK